MSVGSSRLVGVEGVASRSVTRIQVSMLYRWRWERVPENLRCLVDDHHHTALTVARGRTVHPHRVRVVDLDAPNLASVGEARVEATAGEGHAGRVERALGNRVAASEGELDPVADGGADGVGREGESWANLHRVHVAGGRSGGGADRGSGRRGRRAAVTVLRVGQHRCGQHTEEESG